jgi:hypothetical protein
MIHSWQTLFTMLDGKSFRIEKVRVSDSGIAIKGDFTPPPLACLPLEDQMFVSAFIASHGSIKKMETLFGISYPTVKNRLNRIAAGLDIPRVDFGPEQDSGYRRDVLDRLDRGEISFDDAMEALK